MMKQSRVNERTPLGPSHQVEIPPKCISPHSVLQDERAGECLSTPDCLQSSNVNSSATRRDFDRKFTRRMRPWSSAEVALFENSMNFFHKDFSVISKIFEKEGFDRSVKEVVEFYYSWKKSCSRWDFSSEDSAESLDEDEACCESSDCDRITCSVHTTEFLSGKKRRISDYPEFVELQSKAKVARRGSGYTNPLESWTFVYQEPTTQSVGERHVVQYDDVSAVGQSPNEYSYCYSDFEKVEVPLDPYFEDYSSSLDSWSLWN